MYYKEDWEKCKTRLEALWENEIVDRCCIAISVPKNEVATDTDNHSEDYETLIENYTNPEKVLERNIRRFENSYFGGEALPIIFPFFGTGGHCAYVRDCKYQFASDTIWFFPSINSLTKDCIEFDNESPILKIEKEFMKTIAKESEGKFLVSMPDNCGSIDALAELRGSDHLLIDMLEEPEIVQKCVADMVSILKNTGDELFDIIKTSNDGGSSNGWMNTWSPRKHMQLQCDLSVMISPEMYEKFVLPELFATTKWLDNTVYHLDGQEQIRHLDLILSVKKINIIQWSSVAGQPPVSAFIPVLKKIQQAGKGLVLFPKAEEVELLLSELSHKGLFINVVGVKNEEDARHFIKMAENMVHT